MSARAQPETPPDARANAAAHEYAAHSAPCAQHARRHASSESTASRGAAPTRSGVPPTSIAASATKAPHGAAGGADGVGDDEANADRDMPWYVTAATSPPAPSQDPIADASTPAVRKWLGTSCVTLLSRKQGAVGPTSCCMKAEKA